MSACDSPGLTPVAVDATVAVAAAVAVVGGLQLNGYPIFFPNPCAHQDERSQGPSAGFVVLIERVYSRDNASFAHPVACSCVLSARGDPITGQAPIHTPEPQN